MNLVAIIYPDSSKFPVTATREDMLKEIQKQVNELNKKLPTYKHIKGVEIRDIEFEKTTSRKIKRHLVK